jgi:hypothetical protein
VQTRSFIRPAPTSRHVLWRMGVRLSLLIAFAAFAARDFLLALVLLLALSAIFCAVAAVTHRENIFAPELTHWDEAAIYTLLCSLASVLS